MAVLAKDNASCHDGISMEFLKQHWATIGGDYHQMILRGIEDKKLYAGITKQHIILIPMKGDL